MSDSEQEQESVVGSDVAPEPGSTLPEEEQENAGTETQQNDAGTEGQQQQNDDDQ